MNSIVLAIGLLIAPIAVVAAQTPAPSVANPPAPPAAPSVADLVVNAPRPSALTVVGDAGVRPAMRDDPRVQGGKAMRIPVPGRRRQPWDVNVVSPTMKPVKAGDALTLVFWARLEKGEGGTAAIPAAAVQHTAAPYTSLFSAPVTIGPQWERHKVSGRADKDYAAGALAASIHLASGRQTIDIGPVFIIDLGPEAR